MRRKLQKTGSVLLLFTVAMPLLFIVFSFCKRAWVQHEMMEKLEEASLTTVTVSQTAFSWVREGKEVSINGHLFDVYSYKQTGNSFSFTGLFDEDEDKIAENVNAFFDDKANDTNGRMQLCLRFLFLPFWRPAKCESFQPQWQFLTIENHIQTTKSFPKPILAVSAPPPRKAS